MIEQDGFNSDLAALLELLAGNGRHEERWPLVRLGKRDPIPGYVRRAVFERDGGQCLACGEPLTLRTARLDHIVPWSAGGQDHSANLRLLCEPCNADRSNFHGWLDSWAAKRPPVAFWCVSCTNGDYGEGNEDDAPWPAIDLPLAYCYECGLVSRTWLEACY